MRVVSIDPGMTVGVAVGTIFDNKSLEISSQTKWIYPDQLDHLVELFDSCDPSVIVLEQPFNSGPQFNPIPFRVWGAIELYLFQKDRTRLVLQRPDRIPFVQSRFEHCNLKFASHEGDALAHLCYFAYNEHGVKYAYYRPN